MKQFQKIAVGLLGLTHPEMFIQRLEFRSTSTPPGERAQRPTEDRRAPQAPRPGTRRLCDVVDG